MPEIKFDPALALITLAFWIPGVLLLWYNAGTPVAFGVLLIAIGASVRREKA